ncbi:hypothetical protein ACHAWF_011248 [Thalassiosira exigua]
MNNNENPTDYPEEEGGDEFMDERQPSLSDVTHESSDASVSSAASQPKKKKVKVEDDSPEPGAFHGLAGAGFAGDSAVPPLGPVGLRAPPAAYHQNFGLAYGTGLPMPGLVAPPPMPLGSFPGMSPGFGAVNHHPGHFYGYGYGGYGHGYAVAHPAAAASANPAEGRDTPEDPRSKPISGMTPLVFAPAAAAAARSEDDPGATAPGPAPPALEGSVHPALLQIVSSDSQGEGGAATMPHPLTMFPYGGVMALQKPKKWVRWSDHEDQILRQAVEMWGENNFRHISDHVFRGTRTESQCKTRWKKALQPGLVKGRWTREEDKIITDSVAAGNMKWSDIAGHLPGRIGEQVKERWVNNLDPEVKRGVWTADEMRILREAQKELGNKWAEIAKCIPGRSENSVKNRWYNQKTSDRRAQKKKLEEALERQTAHRPDVAAPSKEEEHEDGPMMHIPPRLDDPHEVGDHRDLYEHESDEEYDRSEGDDDAGLNVFEGQGV